MKETEGVPAVPVVVKIGDAVTYVDQFGHEHAALVINVFDNGQPEVYPNPSTNLVLVQSDESMTDSCGRQITRETSVVHQVQQYAHGRYWKRLSE